MDQDSNKKKVINLNSFRKRKKMANTNSINNSKSDSSPLKNRIVVYVQLILVLVAIFYLMQRCQG